ncbi:MAG: rhomboid family intramembrane serine protease [Dehalococcoidia bacterium]|nr:MAG: rhomboid family intramembrane serine protease [Dehalococcoidia bacterium]
MRYNSYRGYSQTPIWAIMIVCFLVFIATLVSQELVFLLGLQPATFLAKPWTIVTNLFVHGGLWHLLANMLTLYFFGRFLIRLTGTQNFLIIYFLGGILGNILFMLLGSPFSIVIGASGAIFALGGTLTVLTPKLRVFVFPIPVPLPLWVAIIGGFFIMSLLPHVAWQGHLGGLLLGLIAGFVLRTRGRRFIY